MNELKEKLKKDGRIIQDAINLLIKTNYLNRISLNMTPNECKACRKKCVFMKHPETQIKFIELTEKGLACLNGESR